MSHKGWLLDAAIVGGAVTAFIAAFLPWWGGAEDLVGPVSVRGWSAGSTAWAGTVLLVAAGGLLLLLRRMGLFSPSAMGRASLLILIVSASGLLLLLLRWLSMTRQGPGLYVGPESGIHVALIAGVVQVAAAAAEFGTTGALTLRSRSGRSALG